MKILISLIVLLLIVLIYSDDINAQNYFSCGLYASQQYWEDGKGFLSVEIWIKTSSVTGHLSQITNSLICLIAASAKDKSYHGGNRIQELFHKQSRPEKMQCISSTMSSSAETIPAKWEPDPNLNAASCQVLKNTINR
jgi:hypothetical protein